MYNSFVFCQSKNKCRWLLLLVPIPVYFLMYNTLYVTPSTPPSQPNDTHVLGENTKTILYWNPMFDQPDFYLGTGSDIFQKCSHKNCYATSKRTQVPIEKFDAIVFHGPQYKIEKFGKPEKRDPKQIYIFFSEESPASTGSFDKKYNDFYNWTMSYRLDSDVIHTYGSVEGQNTSYQSPSIDDVRKRPKQIAWFVSNCNTPSKREIIYKELNKLLPVDVYGRCGDYTCPKSSNCYDMVEQNYKFYLSFENSICQDYVTEKLYKILQKNIVPIVYSGADFTKAAPPNSVINVFDFNTTQALAGYLKYLDTHPDEYLKFFEWKTRFVVKTNDKRGLCSLCQKLNEPLVTKIYSNISEWWAGKNFDKCTSSGHVIFSNFYYIASAVRLLINKFLPT